MISSSKMAANDFFRQNWCTNREQNNFPNSFFLYPDRIGSENIVKMIFIAIQDDRQNGR